MSTRSTISYILLVLSTLEAYVNVPYEVDQYGCWCNFNEHYNRGIGEPVDEMDQLCMEYAKGIECILIDAEMDNNFMCVPWFNEVPLYGAPYGSYTVESYDDDATIFSKCNETNFDGKGFKSNLGDIFCFFLI